MKNIDEQFSDLARPFMDLFVKPLMEMDITRPAEELFGMLAKIQVPGIDMDALVASRRDDLEALVTASREAASGMQSIATQQKKILEDLFVDALQNIQKSADNITKAESAQDMITRQAELTKDSFEKAVDNMRILAKALNEANQRVSRPIIERVPDALDDVGDILNAD